MGLHTVHGPASDLVPSFEKSPRDRVEFNAERHQRRTRARPARRLATKNKAKRAVELHTHHAKGNVLLGVGLESKHDQMKLCHSTISVKHSVKLV
jgi:hypothetical protein